MPPEDDRLLFIEQFEHRGYQIKIARRRDEIRLLIYPPHSNLATRMIKEAIGNYEDAITSARRMVDDMIARSY